MKRLKSARLNDGFLSLARGDIYDRKGNLLVGNRAHYSAVVYLDDLRREFREEYQKSSGRNVQHLKKLTS